VPTIEEIVEEFRMRRRAGRTVVRVANISEAVKVADALRTCGEAQWFRGQVADWPKLAPTYRRLDEDAIQVTQDRLQRFNMWIRATPGLDELAGDPDKLIAVAQHYGIPTTFLDFTTEPRIAGFFASDGGPPPHGLESCIICLNLAEAQELWRMFDRPPASPAPELIEIDVSNLWRLEAQRGLFVWCPYDTLDGPYPLDRIVFPYTGEFATSRAEVYPERASPLERLLNQYFQEEQIREGTRTFHETLAAEKPSLFTTWTFNKAESYIARSFVAPPRSHSSWTDTNTATWLALDREHWAEVAAAPHLTVRVDTRTAPHDTRKRVQAAIAAALSQTPHLRTVAPHWRVDDDGHDNEVVEVLERALQDVWDGMARLPYTDKQVAVALGTTATLVSAYATTDGDREAAARCVVQQPFGVELGGGGQNVHAFAWPDEHSLRAAVRDDFAALLIDEHRDQVLSLTYNILMTARDPRFLFDFPRLIDLFARELIPMQAALDTHNPTYFSPARVEVLGPK
jgi:hypothetical protein